MKLAIIRIRGTHHRTHDVVDTLRLLRLNTTNNCTVVENTPVIMGMIDKVKDFVTWGEVSAETIKLLEARKDDKANVYYLHPPRKGFGAKGIKFQFKNGGALGDRKDKINDLLKVMV